ncbi:MAG: hypothetical protein M3345_05475 [Actinomycetota bacterium]|nr:hypothetical protein [Actinomycetota bacterium]
MSDDEVKRLTEQARQDRKLFERAAQALAEIDRANGLTDQQADVLAALRIRVEGKERASLDELLTTTGSIAGKRDLGDVLGGADKPPAEGWPEVKDEKKDWPGL